MKQSNIKKQIVESFETFQNEASHTSCESVCPFMKECSRSHKRDAITLCETITGRPFPGKDVEVVDPRQLNLFDQC